MMNYTDAILSFTELAIFINISLFIKKYFKTRELSVGTMNRQGLLSTYNGEVNWYTPVYTQCPGKKLATILDYNFRISWWIFK